MILILICAINISIHILRTDLRSIIASTLFTGTILFVLKMEILDIFGKFTRTVYFDVC